MILTRAALLLFISLQTQPTVEQLRFNHDLTIYPRELNTSAVNILGQTPGIGIFYIKACSAPTSTLDPKGTLFDAVIYLDIVDQKLKILHKNGIVANLE